MSFLVSVQNLTKSFGPRPLFSNLTVTFQAGEKVGLIGPNGAGKSTFLRILADLEDIDEGDRSARRGARIGYLAQDDVFPAGQSVREVLLAVLAKEPTEDYEKETQVAIVLTQVGFEDPDQPADVLSGGWRKRLALARELVLEPEFLLMDEPTNHLDLPGVVWLENLLRDAPFGYLVSTHDRAFLRGVANEVMEISRVYPDGYYRTSCKYDEFAERKAAFLEAQAKQQEAVANQVRRETDWLGRQAAARTSKARYRIDQAYEKMDELAELKYRNATANSAGIDFVGTGRKSTKLLTATGISKKLGDKELFAGIDLLLSPGAKLGLLGPNGSGKSTLMKVLSGQLESDSGRITQADGLRTVMFEQGRSALDPSATLQQALCPNGDTVKYRDRSIHVAAWAKQFLFKEEQLGVPVGDLSGGEQARVRIAQLMLTPADLLLLDEPTNDLDIPALEVLEETLEGFPGALVMVTHDRDLMDRLCTEVIGLDGRGNAGMYASVGQWLSAYEDANRELEPPKPDKKEKVQSPPKPKAKKLTYKEKKELEGMEEAILEAEEEVTIHQAEVEQSATDHVALMAACEALEAAQKRVEELYQRWTELEERS